MSITDNLKTLGNFHLYPPSIILNEKQREKKTSVHTYVIPIKIGCVYLYFVVSVNYHNRFEMNLKFKVIRS